MDEDEDTERPAAEAGSAAEDAPPGDESEPADGTADDGWTWDEPEPTDDASTAHPDEEESTPVGDDLVDRVAAQDEQLGMEVEALLQRAFELKDQATQLHERVEELEDEREALESERDDLESEREALESERDDLKQRLVQKQADFKNYKERAKKKQDQIRDRATEDLVERLLPVRDNLNRALEQGEDAEIREGVEATLRDFDRVLEDENVEEVAPKPGDDVDPQRHEVMVRVDSDRPEGDIVDVYRPGYEMAGKVIQTAQVTVSNGADHDPEDESTGASEADAESGDGVSGGEPVEADDLSSDGGVVTGTATDDESE
ncbi:nucleotide exchange factor GrpE [Haloarchaeobius sp. HRN-SO-5]|uniref:nucleotide exchange factor GrpE n=1 Tax=Haloarchaeobius sp. HRN-SO-5 TaxID=3446118 RepID=UPI003EBFE29A